MPPVHKTSSVALLGVGYQFVFAATQLVGYGLIARRFPAE